jgi:hypothetical protein
MSNIEAQKLDITFIFRYKSIRRKIMIDNKKLDEIDEKFMARFKEKEENEDDKIIVPDGIMDLEEYSNAKDKILWILKEANDGGFNLRTFAKDPSTYTKWRKTYALIIKVSYAIHNNVYEYEKIPDEYDIRAITKKIAIINIRKNGGGSTADPKIIYEYYLRDNDLLLEQIKYIEPTIIMNCNRISDLYNKIKGEDIESAIENNKFEGAYLDNGIIINAYHPCIRGFNINHVEYFDYAMDYIKTYRKKGSGE